MMYEPDFERDPNRVYAGDLRAMGVDIPESIPDCASVPRGSIRYGEPKFTGSDDGTMTGSISVEYTEAFEWATVTIKDPNRRVEAKCCPFSCEHFEMEGLVPRCLKTGESFPDNRACQLLEQEACNDRCVRCGTSLEAVTELMTYEARPPLSDVPEERKVPGITQYECPRCDRPDQRDPGTELQGGATMICGECKTILSEAEEQRTGGCAACKIALCDECLASADRWWCYDCKRESCTSCAIWCVTEELDDGDDGVMVCPNCCSEVVSGGRPE